MRIFKYLTENGWVSLYQDAWILCLNKRKNLSDLEDKQEARKNLELIGEDNHTHYHDDRYLPKINALRDEMMNLLEQKMLEVDVKFNALRKDNTDKLIVQDTKPETGVFNQTWICTDKDELSIRVYDGVDWVAIAGVENERINISIEDWTFDGSIYKFEKSISSNFSISSIYMKKDSSYERVIGIDKIIITSDGKLTLESSVAFEGFVVICISA